MFSPFQFFLAMTIIAALGGLPLAAAGQGTVAPTPDVRADSAAPPKAALAPRVDATPLKRGVQWQNGPNLYAVVPEVRAIRLETKHESPASAFSRLGVTTGSVLDRKSGYLIYRDSAGPKPLAGASGPAPLLARKADPRPVAQNLRTGRFAVVLNAIRVDLKDLTAAEPLASESGITLGRQFPGRARVYYAVPAGMDLVGLVGRLRADARVASADLELVEFTRGPN